MALDLAGLTTRIRLNTNRESSGDTATTDATITPLLNFALREIARRHDWRQLFTSKTMTTIAGTERYAFPTDMNRLLSMTMWNSTTSYTLAERTKTWLNSYDSRQALSSTGVPAVYAVDGLYFELVPRPDAVYTLAVNYIKWPATLVNATDAPDVETMDDCLIAYATSQLFAQLERFDQADWWMREFERRFVTARATDNTRPNFMPQQDGVVSGKTGGYNTDYPYDPQVGLSAVLD